MEQLWQETNALLDSIYQEYNAVLQELATTTDRQRIKQLRAMASTCVAEYQAAVWRYRAAKSPRTSVST
jgi:primosomal protein N''